MAESFEYVKKLIGAERFKGYKTEEWGDCDVIIISKNKYNSEKNKYDNWKEKNKDFRQLVITNFASSIIWLIETLKPYINCDYIDKYQYYCELATLINQQKGKVKNEKELLNEIMLFLENQKPSWEKVLGKPDLENSLMNWYNFGIKHNDPFFVKFVALWMAFNELYMEFPGIDESKGRDDIEYKKIDEFCESDKYSSKIESVHEKIFNSPFVQIFMTDKVKDMKRGYYTRVNKDNYKYLTKGNGLVQSKALLQTIYQVRNNLLHGSKTPDEKRDIELVRCSGEIMEIYMNAIMENK